MNKALPLVFPHLCAHRGLSKACPENTLPAFAAAIAIGAPEIEFDLRSSKDGIPVVCHDGTVDGTTTGTGKINDLLWEEIRTLDAGIKHSEVWRGIGIPSFMQVLDVVTPHTVMNIHMKEVGTDGKLLQKVCALLREKNLVASSYLALESENDLKTAIQLAPDFQRACLGAQGDPDRLIEVAQKYSCHRIQFGRKVTSEQIARAHEAGLICNLFWSDEWSDAREYLEKGIDVILTNCAAELMVDGFGTISPSV